MATFYDRPNHNNHHGKRPDPLVTPSGVVTIRSKVRKPKSRVPKRTQQVTQ